MQYLPVVMLFILFAINVPVAFAIAVSALIYFFIAEGLPLTIFVQKIVSATHSFPLLAVPFFITAGTIMNYGGITKRLMALADALTGHMAGGLAQVNVVLSTLMGGLSGSANADAAMQSKILVPEMIKRNYDADFSAVVTDYSAGDRVDSLRLSRGSIRWTPVYCRGSARDYDVFCVDVCCQQDLGEKKLCLRPKPESHQR